MKVTSKKIIGLFLCMLMLAMIPLAAGIDIAPDAEEETLQLGSTFMFGIITKPSLRNGGHSIVFRAVWLKYRTRGIGEIQSGTLRLFQKLTLPNDFMGFVGNHFVMARFSGALDV